MTRLLRFADGGLRRFLDYVHRPAGHDEHLARGHDLLAGFDALIDDDQVSLPLPGDDRANLRKRRRLVLHLAFFQNVYIRTLLPDLLSFGGYQNRTFPCAQNEPDVDELSGPEIAIAIGDSGAKLDRARA